MLYVGSDDGVYRFTGVRNPDEAFGVEHVLESAAVMRLRPLEQLDGSEGSDGTDGRFGLFAATKSGLYHSVAGGDWTDLGVPVESVYSVGVSADGETLYAGTRPAELYAASVPSTTAFARGDVARSDLEWRECEGFQDLPSREHWRLPRHDGLAQVRDVKGLPGAPESVAAAVEVGGVHASADRGETWVERRGDVDANALQGVDRSDDWSRRLGDVHDDVHELAVVDAVEWIAATGFGLFRTTDAGRSWTRLDDAVDQRYFRTVAALGDSVYAAGALSSSGNWDDPDENPGFFAYRPGDGLSTIDYPCPAEVVTGLLAVEGTVYAGTHRGTLLREPTGRAAVEEEEVWPVVGEFPVGPDSTGTYTPLAWLGA